MGKAVDATNGTVKPEAAKAVEPPIPTAKNARVLQSDMPKRSIRDALRVAQALVDNYAGHPTAPHDVALALGISPTSSSWRELTGAAQGYGLVKGGYNADRISLDTLGRRATSPTEEGDDIRAKAEASLKPKIFGDFFRRYDRSKFPPDQIAKNVLHQQFGVPIDRVDAVLQLIKDNGQFAGFIRDTKTGPFVALENPQPVPVRLTDSESAEDDDLPPQEGRGGSVERKTVTSEKTEIERDPSSSNSQLGKPAVPFRVFITHGKNLNIVDQVKDVLSLYDIDFEIAVEEETAAIPVPQKVMEAMRRCSAGIMVVTADEQSRNGDQFSINTNVLIEIGAAFVLYDQRVVLLWDKRLKVPSNLQGLYRIEFEGAELSFSTGTRLAKSVKSLRTS